LALKVSKFQSPTNRGRASDLIANFVLSHCDDGFNPLPIGDGLPTQAEMTILGLARAVSIPYQSGTGFRLPRAAFRTLEHKAPVSIPYQSGTGFRPALPGCGDCGTAGFNPLPIGDGLPTLANSSSFTVMGVGFNPLPIGDGLPTRGTRAANVRPIFRFNPLPIGDGLPTVSQTATGGTIPVRFQSPTNRGRASDRSSASSGRTGGRVSIPYQSGTGFRQYLNDVTFGQVATFQSPTNRGRASDCGGSSY